MQTPLLPSWIEVFKNPRAQFRLFCFPYAGGSASVFKPWVPLLPEFEICAIQLPGRASRMKEPAMDRLTPLVAALAEPMHQYLDRPFAFFGHSLGALVSFEVARSLRRQHGIAPMHLFVSGRQPPHLPDRKQVYNLPEPDFLNVLESYNGTPRQVLQDPDLLSLLLPTLRADFAVSNTYGYEAGTLLDCPISVYCGLQDDLVDLASLDEWRIHTAASCTVQFFPGDHFYLKSSPGLLLQVLGDDFYETRLRLRAAGQ